MLIFGDYADHIGTFEGMGVQCERQRGTRRSEDILLRDVRGVQPKGIFCSVLNEQFDS